MIGRYRYRTLLLTIPSVSGSVPARKKVPGTPKDFADFLRNLEQLTVNQVWIAGGVTWAEVDYNGTNPCYKASGRLIQQQLK